MNSSASITDAYKQTDLTYRVLESKIGCIVALLLVPAGVTLDFFIYPDKLYDFMLLRLSCDIVISAFLALHFTKWGQRNIKLLSFCWLISVQIMIATMIYQTEGYESTYYAGLNLPIIAIGILLPSSNKESILFCSFSIAIYCVACLAHTPSVGIDEMYNILYFMLLTSIISVTSVHFNVRRRFSEFRLSYELDSRNKELTEIDRLKSQFLANISHELRTPLTLILSPTQDMLQNHPLPEKTRQLLSTVQENGLRLLKLVNDLLEIVRLEEGKTKLQKNPVELSPLMDGLIESVNHLAQSKQITIQKQLSNDRMPVLGDLRALEKVFLNILINAIKFTEAGGHIKVSSNISAGNMGILEIRDTGIGISESELPYIFDRFHQADGSSTRKQQGTGLGLALARELTEKHGGEITAVSTEGAGTTIRISLPLITEDTQLEPAPQIDAAHKENDAIEKLHRQAEYSSPIKAAALSSGHTEGHPSYELGTSAHRPNAPTLLIVEDEPDMLRYLAAILSEDYRVYQASDGRQGLSIANRFLPDLILLDLMLPEIDGLGVCRAIKENDELKHSKVMLLTSRVDETAKLSALKLGADDFLTKPFSSLEVKTRLSNLYQTTQLQRDLNSRNIELKNTLNELRQTQSQLLQSEKLNALGKLSAGLLHEINNPLNYTLTALQIALNDPVITADEGLLEICQDVNDGMQRIKDIVTDLRAFAYPTEAQKESLFYFHEAMENALRFTSQEHKGITLVKRGCDETAIIGSQTHITQVLVNLIANASDAVHKADRGTAGAIEIDCHPEQGRLHVRIKDNGVGIARESLQYIFDPFYTTRDVGQGMGLGLSICHTIIKNHGGNLTADSEPGQWTAFEFDLPLAS